MDDLISRQAAIDSLEEPCKVPETWTDEYAVGERAQYEKDVKALNSLLPAEPERPSEIQDILDYLDTVLHPIVSPEHWNVYSELHDMISTLPSAERWGRWINGNEGNWNAVIVPKCSICGETFYEMNVNINGEYTYNYCPNCGARMEAE